MILPGPRRLGGVAVKNPRTLLCGWLMGVSGASVFLLVFSGAALAQQYMQLAGAIHVHTTFSSGQHTLDELVQKGKQKGLEVLIPTDHDLVVMEYGIFPFRNLIKKREKRRSVLEAGPEKYLLTISELNKQQQEVLVIPGVQSSPFYFWTGSPFKKNLTAHDYRKELLVIGMKHPDDYRNLPLLHRGFSLRYVKQHLPRTIVFLGAFFLSLILIFQKGILRAVGIVICFFSLMLSINHHPFQSSRFDPYHGDQGAAPFQELIDYARDRKGLVFWAHPESKYAKDGVTIGPIRLMTKPYPDAILETRNYTGFSGIYGDEVMMTDPGKQWDTALSEFCADKRSRPPWVISGSDYHADRDGIGLDTYQTVFLVREKTVAAVLEAMAKGKMYALEKGGRALFRLDGISVRDSLAGQAADMGTGVRLDNSPVVRMSVSASDKGKYPIVVTLNRSGKRIAEFRGDTPLTIEFRDPDNWTGKTFYRVEARSRELGRLLSNPVFAMRGPKEASKN